LFMLRDGGGNGYGWGGSARGMAGSDAAAECRQHVRDVDECGEGGQSGHAAGAGGRGYGCGGPAVRLHEVRDPVRAERVERSFCGWLLGEAGSLTEDE